MSSMDYTDVFDGRISDPTRTVNLGDDLMVDAAAGDTVLLVEEASPFNQETGGWLNVRFSANTADDDDTPLVDLQLEYTGWVGDDDDYPYDAINLTVPLTVPIPAGTKIDVWSLSANGGAGGPSVVYEVQFMSVDSDDSTPLTATLTQEMVDAIPSETLPGPGQAITVGTPKGSTELTVLSIDGGELARDGEYSPDVVAATERTTGMRGGTFATATDGPRGLLEEDRLSFWSGDDVNLPVLIQAIVEETRQVLRLSSGRQSVGDIDAQIVLQSAPSPVLREIILRTGVVRALGEIMAQAGATVQNGLTVETGAVEFLGNAGVTLDTYLVLQRGNNRLFGFRSGSVLRTMNADGRTTIAHNFPVTPSAVHANLLGSGESWRYFLHVVGKNASDFTVEVRERAAPFTLANGIEFRIEYTVTSTDA